MTLKRCLNFYIVFQCLGIFPFAVAQQRPDMTITIFEEANRRGERELASVGNCLSLYQFSHLRPKVGIVRSIAYGSDLSCLRFYAYECCTGPFSDFDPVKERQDSPRLTQIHTNVTDDPQWFDPRSIGPCLSQSDYLGSVPPPQLLIDPGFSAVEVTKDNTNVKQHDDRNAAVYISYEQELGNDVHWLYDIFSLGWGYVKDTYGNFGSEGKLYGIYHGDDHSEQDLEKRTFLHRFATSNCRNVIRVFSTQNITTAARKGDKSELDAITLEMAALVDNGFNGTLGSPCYKLWPEAWADIFRYDLYLFLGMNEDAERIAAEAANRFHDEPTKGSQWFTKWFKPIYEKYNGTQPLVRFFQLREQYFPTVVFSMIGPVFSRVMNLGEYVHFTSGTVDENLWVEAYRAFNLQNNYSKWKKQFDEAQRNFPDIKYKNFDRFKNTEG